MKHVKHRQDRATLPSLALLLCVTWQGSPGAAQAAPADAEAAAAAAGAASVEASVEASDGTPAVAAGTGVLQPRWITPRRGGGEGPSPSGTKGDEPLSLAADDQASSSVTGNDAAERDWRSDARILVHGEAAAGRLASVIEKMLERFGAEDVERRLVEVSASSDQIRYFHAEDAAMAAALAAALEPVFGQVRVRDLTFYRPTPSRGSLEVWLR